MQQGSIPHELQHGTAMEAPQPAASPPSEPLCAFRQAEKRFKAIIPPPERGRRRRNKPSTVQVDLQDVIDLTAIDQLIASGTVQQHPVPGHQVDTSELNAVVAATHIPGHVAAQQASDTPAQPTQPPTLYAYTFSAHPGFVIIPGALTPQEQLALATAALTLYPEPPALTNHDRQLGPLPGLWTAAHQGMVLKHMAPDTPHHNDTGDMYADTLKQADTHADAAAAGEAADKHEACDDKGHPVSGSSPSTSSAPQLPPTDILTFDECWDKAPQGHAAVSGCGGHTQAPVTAASLLKRLRHAVLGPHFDWNIRKYIFDRQHRLLPEGLRRLAVHWGNIAQSLAPHPHHQPDSNQGPYHPDAALVHFYSSGDTLMGHQDDVEKDLDQPIVTVSLGCAAVFLQGGPTKDEFPTAILVRSGDVMVLSGKARRCYHGVPRILPNSLPSTLEPVTDVLDSAAVRTHLQHTRINISIRAV